MIFAFIGGLVLGQAFGILVTTVLTNYEDAEWEELD